MPPLLDTSSRLKKELTLFHVYAIATGATLSSGLFLLPGPAAHAVGPAVVLAYLIAAVPLVPAMFSMAELATAMPRAGGAYYFIDRSLGPLAGTVGGLGTWLALSLKTAFALVGMGAYLALVLHAAPYWLVKVIACGLAVLFGAVNLLGPRSSGRMQAVLVMGLLAILVWFIVAGVPEIDVTHFRGFVDAGGERIIATAGVVYISYVGITKVASISEEVKNPERNLPRALFLALGTAVLIYGLCIVVMTGVVPREELGASLTPMAAAAGRVVGEWGVALVALAAVLAFSSVANVGILSSSRYPLAMSRDHMLPRFFRKLNARRTPGNSIVVTVGAILLMVIVLDPLQIAELASAFQLLMFAMLCLAVVVMRESRIEAYDPGYRSPLYPWMQLFGIVAPFFLISEMGLLPILFSIALVVVGVVWFCLYAQPRIERYGAIYHVFERLGRQRYEDLDRELRGILKEKGLRADDPFLEVVARAFVIDLAEERSFEDVVEAAAGLLAGRVPADAGTLARGFLEGTRIGATPVAKGAALPHLRLAEVKQPVMVLVRSRSGVRIVTGDVLGRSEASLIHAIFFLVSSEADAGQHLRLLAELASRIDEEDFVDEWREAGDEQRLKEILLQHDRYVTLRLARGLWTEPFIDRRIRDLDLPRGCLVAVVRRRGEILVPGGDTVVHEGDQLTVIGSEAAVRACKERYGSGVARGLGDAEPPAGEEPAPPQ